jgi:DNA helicase-2/ATP-dependent DNA helicase PcrA
MAVLVRAKAQTPPVELALIQAQIPYEVVGSEPFYDRWEVSTLIAYCRLALFEAQMQKGKPLPAAERSQLVESWEQCYRHPKRYISQSEAQQISAELVSAHAPISETLRKVVIADKPYVAQRLGEIATLLQWLSGAFAGGKAARKDAHALLQELERKLGYCAYLERRSTRSEAGVDEAENVRQFIEEARDRGSLLEYLVYLKQLGEQQVALQKAAGRNLLTIRTIHSAKGLEWPVVILPSCDDDNIPHRKSDNVEEERRLLYVALTRSRRDLYIYHLAAQPSSFLVQAKWQTTLRAVQEIRSALSKPAAQWSLEEVRAVAIAAPQLGLLDYFQEWHTWHAGQQAEVVQRVLAYLEGQGSERAPRLDRASSDKLRAMWQSATANGPVSPPDPQPSRPALPATPVAPRQPQPAGVRRQVAPAGSASANGAHAHSKARHAHQWQTFDEVVHPQFGRGIVISTTTTTQGRELKVQFVDGRLQHFRDNDPSLSAETAQ